MSVLRSKFRRWIYWIVGLLVLTLVFMAWIISITYKDPEMPLVLGLLMFGLFALIPAWLIYGEFRTKAVVAWIDGNSITIANYLGLGGKRAFSFSEFDGFHTVILPSEWEDYEYLYLMKDGRKKIRLSQFYHSNYGELKACIKGKVKNLGRIDFSIAGELKDIFR